MGRLTLNIPAVPAVPAAWRNLLAGSGCTSPSLSLPALTCPPSHTMGSAHAAVAAAVAARDAAAPGPGPPRSSLPVHAADSSAGCGTCLAAVGAEAAAEAEAGTEAEAEAGTEIGIEAEAAAGTGTKAGTGAGTGAGGKAGVLSLDGGVCVPDPFWEGAGSCCRSGGALAAMASTRTLLGRGAAAATAGVKATPVGSALPSL